MQLPLFPLSTPMLPSGILPLRLFETRYIEMVKNCFKTETGFGVCLIEKGNEVGTPSKPYPLGTTVSIIDFDQGEDGLLHITVQGEQEFHLLSYTVDESQLLVGELTLLPNKDTLVMTSEYQMLSDKLAIILEYVQPHIKYPEVKLDDPNWVCHRLIELLPIDAPAKYDLLRLTSNVDRLRALLALNIEISAQS